MISPVLTQKFNAIIYINNTGPTVSTEEEDHSQTAGTTLAVQDLEQIKVLKEKKC